MNDSILSEVINLAAISTRASQVKKTVNESSIMGRFGGLDFTEMKQGMLSYEEKKDSLAAAFEFFNETSMQLSQTYQLLEDKIDSLKKELDHVSAEKERHQSEKNQVKGQMQALIESLPGGVIVLNDRGAIVQTNPVAEQLLDVTLMGKLWRDVIGETFAPRNDDGLEVSTRNGKRISIATSSLGDNGQVILLTDQTETRKLQQALSRHERLTEMGKMVSALAHQIRTPLSAALLYADHLVDKKLNDRQRNDFSKKVLSRLMHMERQVRDMLLFVKSELPLNDCSSAKDLLNGLQEAAEIPLSTSESKCDWRIDQANLTIKCNREALISALMNLINNAIQASGKSAFLRVRIGLKKRSDISMLCLSITDFGPGIAPNILQSAGEMFVTTKAQGTGLGLAVVRAIAKAHGGEFKLYSHLGRGTKATLCIPTM